MKHIGVVTNYRWLRGKNPTWYPMEKWKKNFSSNGYTFHFYTNHAEKGLLNKDAVILDERYINEEMANKKKYTDKSFVFSIHPTNYIFRGMFEDGSLLVKKQ